MRWVYRLAAVLTGAAALGVSWWSLYELGVALGIPSVLAGGLSAVFDLAALTCVGLAERYAATPDSGAGPRLALMLMLAGSVYLNVRHAELTLGADWITGAVAYAMPAVIACLLLELHLRFANREQRRALGRVAPSLPVLGGWAFVMFPIRSVQVLRSHVRVRLDEVANEAVAPILATAEVVRTLGDGPTHDARELSAAAPVRSHGEQGKHSSDAALQLINGGRTEGTEHRVRPTEGPLGNPAGAGVLPEGAPDEQDEPPSHVLGGAPREIAAEALARTGNDVRAARRLLNEWGADVHPSTVYRARKQLTERADDSQDSPAPPQPPQSRDAAYEQQLRELHESRVSESRANVRTLAPESEAEQTLVMPRVDIPRPTHWS